MHISLSLLQETEDPQSKASSMTLPQPVLMVSGDDYNQIGSTAYLVCEKEMVCKIPDVGEALLILWESFYIFNMEYTMGCVNFYSFMDAYFLDAKVPGNATSIKALLSTLKAL